MIYKTGTKITCKGDGQTFTVVKSTAEVTHYRGNGIFAGYCPTHLVTDQFVVDGEPLLTVTEALIAIEARPDVLFDGRSVYMALTPEARTRTSAENVGDVLDAIVKLIKGK